MKDMERHLESLWRDAAECQRISTAAADKAKRDLFARLAEHHRLLAIEVERAISDQQTRASGVDRSMLSRHLATADRHITEGQRQIAEQEAAVEQLNQNGSNTAQALVSFRY